MNSQSFTECYVSKWIRSNFGDFYLVSVPAPGGTSNQLPDVRNNLKRKREVLGSTDKPENPKKKCLSQPQFPADFPIGLKRKGKNSSIPTPENPIKRTRLSPCFDSPSRKILKARRCRFQVVDEEPVIEILPEDTRPERDPFVWPFYPCPCTDCFRREVEELEALMENLCIS